MAIGSNISITVDMLELVIDTHEHGGFNHFFDIVYPYSSPTVFSHCVGTVTS